MISLKEWSFKTGLTLYKNKFNDFDKLSILLTTVIPP
jgi:hypothetical protein